MESLGISPALSPPRVLPRASSTVTISSSSTSASGAGIMPLASSCSGVSDESSRVTPPGRFQVHSRLVPSDWTGFVGD